VVEAVVDVPKPGGAMAERGVLDAGKLELHDAA